MSGDPEEAYARAQELHEELNRILGLGKDCINCDNWEQDLNLCGKFQVLPPPIIIARGCSDWNPRLPF